MMWSCQKQNYEWLCVLSRDGNEIVWMGGSSPFNLGRSVINTFPQFYRCLFMKTMLIRNQWFDEVFNIRILQRVLCDLSQISMVCFIIGMIGTMMKAAAEQTDRVLRDTSQISLNLWCSVSWSERPTGTEQITCCPANCRQTRTLKGEPSSSWRTPEKQSSDIVNFLDTNNLPKIQWRSWVPCSWRWINCLTSTVWSGIILNHIDIWYLLAIFIRKQESICRRSLLKMKDFQPLNIPVHSSTPPPPRICLHWQFLKTLNAPHKLLKAITLNLL